MTRYQNIDVVIEMEKQINKRYDKNKLTPLILPDELREKAKKLSVQILGKENISGIIRYLIKKRKD